MSQRRPLPPHDRSVSWKERAEELLVDVRALYLAARDPRTPLLAKLVAIFVASYVASPIQLIPNWIPGIGYLDDLAVAIAGIRFIRHIVPASLMDEYVERARRMRAPDALPNAALALAVVSVGGLLLALGAWTLLLFLRR